MTAFTPVTPLKLIRGYYVFFKIKYDHKLKLYFDEDIKTFNQYQWSEKDKWRRL